MQKLLSIAEDIAAEKADWLIHAPFVDRRNISPFAFLNKTNSYDFKPCSNHSCILFATQDKIETLGLIGKLIQNAPKNLTIIWPNDKGGKGLSKHLQKLGLRAYHEAKAHTRFVHITDFDDLNEGVLKEWIDNASPIIVPNTSLQAQAGLFSWRSIDPASALLTKILSDLSGQGADFGAGWGYLSQHILNNKAVTSLETIEVDKRAIDLLKTNINDPRLNPLWADVTQFKPDHLYDFIVMNPPFHAHGREDQSLGQAFIEKAASCLTKGGKLYLVANRHLPYEHLLNNLYKEFNIITDQQGYKIIEAIK